VIALAIGLGAWRWHTEPTCRSEQIVRRYLLIFAIGVGLGYALKYILPDPEVMTCTMVGLTASFIYMMAKRRDAWPVVVAGGIGFGVFYLLMVKVSLLVWPHFIHQWRPDVPLGYWWGVPVYEIVWSIGFGACWPLYMVFALGIHSRAAPSCASHAGRQSSEAPWVHQNNWQSAEQGFGDDAAPGGMGSGSGPCRDTHPSSAGACHFVVSGQSIW
jgi:hypothetical protein